MTAGLIFTACWLTAVLAVDRYLIRLHRAVMSTRREPAG